MTMKTLFSIFAYFLAITLLWLELPISATAQVPSIPLKIVSVLSKPLEEIEKLLGKPRHVGEERECYYKVPGFVRIVVRPTPQKLLATITFQFEQGKVKSETEALAKVGVADAVLPDRWTSRWSAPGDSKNDELTLSRVQETAIPATSKVTIQNVILTNHFRERMQERGVSEAQALDVLQNGQRFYDQKNDSYIRWKDGIYIAQTKDGILKTVVRGTVSSRWKPL